MDNQEPVSYRVVFTEPAEADIEKETIKRLRRTSPEAVTKWRVGLQEVADSLSLFPRRNPRVRPDSFEGDVRRTLYGRGRSATYLIYRTYDPGEVENGGIVRILAIWPTAMQASSENNASSDDGEA